MRGEIMKEWIKDVLDLLSLVGLVFVLYMAGVLMI